VNGLLGGFLGRVLRDAALFLMQTEDDAQRLRTLGAPAERVLVAGNMKYDLAPPEENPLVAWLEQVVEAQKRRPVVVAGSVMEGEERAVLDAFAAVRHRQPGALLVLAPRKPERFADAARLTTDAGWNVARRSRIALDRPLREGTEVLLLDSVGELAALYRLADLVFVGGSLVPSGGHNILEPAFFLKPPVFGPSMENFREMAGRFLTAGAGLLEDTALRENMGRRAGQLVEQNAGAALLALQHIEAILSASEAKV
jgi:3-deoxy-D-manno-octulosonic-acid transferase